MDEELPAWLEYAPLRDATAADLRRSIVRDIIAVAGSQLGLYYGVSLINGELHWTDVHSFGPEHRSRYLTQCRGRAVREFTDLTASTLTTTNAFCEISVDDCCDTKMFDTMLGPMQARWILGMTALVEGVVVGWVGAYRFAGEEPFGNDVARELKARAASYISDLASAHRLDDYGAGERGMIVLDVAGRVEFACENGRAWLDRPGFSGILRAATVEHGLSGGSDAHWTAGGRLRLTRVASGDRELYCAELQPVRDVVAPVIMKLSHRKRQIAELASIGATVAEIALQLTISAETVRSHLKQIYEALGVSSRAELRQRLGVFG